MTRVDLIREKLKDQREISLFVNRFFQDNPDGIVFKAFKKLTVNFCGELYFIVF